MKLLSLNGYLYRSYWNKTKGYTCKESLHLKDSQNNRRIAQKIIRKYQINKLDNYIEDTVNYIRLSRALAEFLEFKNLKPKTAQIYKQAAAHLITVAGDKYIQQYTHKDYAALLKYFRTPKKILLDYRSNKNDKKFITKSLAQNSQAIYTRTLKALFNYYLKHKHIQENIIEAIPSAEAKPTPIDEDDLTKILNVLKKYPHQYALTYFLVNTGIRKSTALELCWDDIDWENKLIKFRNIKVKGKEYTFPLIPRLQDLLKSMDVKKSGKVFPYKNDYGLIFFKRAQNGLALKRTYSIHKLKHTFVSQLVNAGMSLEDVSELTNTSLRTLKKNYLKMDKSRIADKLQSIKITG
jgi:integrase